MDYKSCPLKKRPVNIDIHGYPQDLSLKRKATDEIDTVNAKKNCPLDLSFSSPLNYSINDDYNDMNPTNWHNRKNNFFEKRSESPVSTISNESSYSRSSSVSPITINKTQKFNYNDKVSSYLHTPDYHQTSQNWSSYQSTLLSNSSYIDYQTSFEIEPEDLSVQTYIPLPALNHEINENIRHQQHSTNKCSNCENCRESSANSHLKLSKQVQFYFSKSLQKSNDQDEKLFNCRECDKKYTTNGALKMHIRTHTLPCKCEICGKSFSRPWLLRGHIRTHTGEKPFSCEFCSKSFADRSNLRSHQQTHATIKKYNCISCKKSFSRMSLLKKHFDDCNSCCY